MCTCEGEAVMRWEELGEGRAAGVLKEWGDSGRREEVEWEEALWTPSGKDKGEDTGMGHGGRWHPLPTPTQAGP